ncbi:MAG: tyrosine-type recombinase/integrase, partial [Bdellovibrionales bacterium]|nr:tyrosine-type recombinase/integrase [Bdellovibrionales bacterium]
MSSKLPALRQYKENSENSDSLHYQLWTRINAFLSVRSEGTQRTYVGIFREWCNFLGTEPGTPQATEAILSASDIDAARYNDWLKKRPGQAPRGQSTHSEQLDLSTETRRSTARDGMQATLSNSTIAKKLTALRRLYRMIVNSDMGLSRNPFDTDKLPAPKSRSGQKRPTEMIDFELVSQIVSAPDGDTAKGIRDRAILAALFGGGLRRGELTRLRVGDVRSTARGTCYLRLRATKAGTDADQALPAWAAQYLQMWLELRKKSGANFGDYLFVSYRGRGGSSATDKPISASGIYRLFKHYCGVVQDSSHFSPHSARATAITRLLE